MGKRGEQPSLVLLPHGEGHAVQHLDGVRLKPEHLIHIDDDAPVAQQKARVGAQALLDGRERRGRAVFALAGADADVVVLRERVFDPAERDENDLTRDTQLQLLLKHKYLQFI